MPKRILLLLTMLLTLAVGATAAQALGWLSVSGDSPDDFGKIRVGKSKTMYVYIWNASTYDDLTFGAQCREVAPDWLTPGDPANTFSCGGSYSLGPGEETSIPVTFTPTHRGGFTGEMQFSLRAGDGGQSNYIMEGTGCKRKNHKLRC